MSQIGLTVAIVVLVVAIYRHMREEESKEQARQDKLALLREYERMEAHRANVSYLWQD